MAEWYEALVGSSYQAQAMTLKGEASKGLGEVRKIWSEAVTPEERIVAYRMAQLKLMDVDEVLEELEDLALQAGVTKQFKGFVGGAGLVSVWGLVLVMLFGFGGLAMLIKNPELAGAVAKGRVVRPKRVGSSKAMSSNQKALRVLVASEFSCARPRCESARPVTDRRRVSC